MKVKHRPWRIIFSLFLLLITVGVSAQSTGDKLYLEGWKLEQKGTHASLTQAINKYKAAKSVYSASNKKQICDNRIAICNDKIEKLLDGNTDEQTEKDERAGLMATLPYGTTRFVGDMGGFPIEFIITKDRTSGKMTAKYRNIKYDATMYFKAESHSSMSGYTDFTSKDSQSKLWIFRLKGDVNAITGKGIGDGKELRITLRKE